MQKLTTLAVALTLAACTSVSSPSRQAQSTIPVYPPRPLTLLYTTFQDHAVLQRSKPIPVWGLTEPHAKVTVTLAGENASTEADPSGQWKLTLPALPAGGPYQLSAASSAGKSQTVTDIMIGDVYLCSGQSNMEYPVRIVGGYDADMKGAANRSIRLFHVQRFSSGTPRSSFGADASWSVTSPDAVKDFSATCYFFGRSLQPAVNVPLGLIEDSWGGSVLQTWLSTEAVQRLGGYEHQLAVMADYARDPLASQRQWLEFTNAWWRTNDPGTPGWSDPAFDDSAWDTIVPAGDWEGWGIPALSNFDGIVWFRKTVTLTAAQAKGTATLSLGPVDDIDTTWINGRQIGGEEGWDTPRVYTLPAGTLHEGVNVIAIGVLDTGAGGGMWGTADEKTITFSNGSLLKLNTPWHYRISAPLAKLAPMPHAPWLKESGLSMLFNGMIVPLGSTQIRGIVWYQGESDTAQAKEYARLLPTLISDWRERFGADVAFLDVQLPGYGPAASKPGKSNWAELREVQRRAIRTAENAALVVTTDLGERDNIHPTNKQEVGRRLALAARKLIYGEPVVAEGPTPLSAVRKANTVTLGFENTGKGLVAYESNRPISFQLCDGADKCSFADALLQGDTIELDASQVPSATTVRFCWSESPICNLYNVEGLPAVPFAIEIVQAPVHSVRNVKGPGTHGRRIRRKAIP
jgi:sialate O-acetylesterase